MNINRMTFCKQIDIFSAADTAALRCFLDQREEDDFFYERRYQRRGLIKKLPPDYNFVIHWAAQFKVDFDVKGKISSERVTEVYRGYPGYDRVHNLFIKAMESMAQECGWASTTELMAITIMQHFSLKKGLETPPIAWHRDSGSHSMVVLIDDHTRWNGGEFIFKQNEEEQIFVPQEGKGILFSNEGTQHCVTPIIANEDLINRTILTVHRHDVVR